LHGEGDGALGDHDGSDARIRGIGRGADGQEVGADVEPDATVHPLDCLDHTAPAADDTQAYALAPHVVGEHVRVGRAAPRCPRVEELVDHDIGLGEHVGAHGRTVTPGRPGGGRMAAMSSPHPTAAVPSATVSSTVSSDGTTLAYRVLGDPAARPLVLVHGWSQSSACWGPELLAPLAERYRVVAVDLRGHGHSGVAGSGYDSAEQWADDLAAV